MTTTNEQKQARIKFAKGMLSCLEAFLSKYNATLLPQDKATPDKTRIECKHTNGNVAYLSLIHNWQPDCRGLIPCMFSLIIEDADGKRDLGWYGTSFWHAEDPYEKLKLWGIVLDRLDAVLVNRAVRFNGDHTLLRDWLVTGVTVALNDPNIAIVRDGEYNHYSNISVAFNSQICLKLGVYVNPDGSTFYIHGVDINDHRDSSVFVATPCDYNNKEEFDVAVIELVDWIKSQYE